MTHEFPLPPSSNRYWRHYQGKMVVSPEAKQYREIVKMLAKCDGARQQDGPICVTVHVFRQRKSGDLDNRLKIVLDACQGALYANDSQIQEIHAYLADDKHNPRCEVTVTPASVLIT